MTAICDCGLGPITGCAKCDAPAHTPAADLIAFLDAQRVTISALHEDGTFWMIRRGADGFHVLARDSDGAIKLQRDCSTQHEAIDVMCKYEHLRAS